MAAFSTGKESQVYNAASLVRKASSSYQEEESEAPQDNAEGSRFH